LVHVWFHLARALVCMAISPDLSDPLDDAKGGISLWGRWLQDRDEQVVLKLRVATGTKGRAVRVDFKSASLKVAVNAEVCMDGTLSAQVLPDECEWQLDDDAEGGRELVVTLRKASPGWWDRVLQQDAPISTKAFDEPPFMLGGMTDLQHESMRDHVARMTGGGTPGSAWDGR